MITLPPPPLVERVDIPASTAGAAICGGYRTRAGEIRILAKMPVTIVFTDGRALEVDLQVWADEAGNVMTDEPIPEHQFKAIGQNIAEFLVR